MSKTKIKNNSKQNNFLIENIKNAYNKSLELDSKLPTWILEIEGMSGKMYRHFINNLCQNVENCRYLEIGCWRGSTICSAIYGNDITSYVIDNWSEFDGLNGPKQEFQNNVRRCMDETENDTTCEFEENDYKQIDYSSIDKYNLYFYDGPHEYEDQYNALTLTLECLDDEFIFICDDWNWEQVREGTNKSIEDLGLKIKYSVEIYTDVPDENGNIFQNSDWHNGYFISVLKK